MTKVKKVEKRSAPKKAAKKVVPKDRDDPLGMKRTLREIQKSKPVSKEKPDPDAYERIAHAIMTGRPKPTKPEPKSKATPKKVPKLAKTSNPERVPEKPPEPEPPKVEVKVRNIYHDGQYLPALCFRKPGALHVPCVAGDPANGVRKFTVNASQHDKSTILQHGYGAFAAEYTPERFAEHMRQIASAAPITPEARALLLPYAPDMPSGPAPVGLPVEHGLEPAIAAQRAVTSPRKASGPARTSGKDLIRTLADASGLPPEKIRAKLRAAGMRAPYTSEADCRKALDLVPPQINKPRRKQA